MTIGSGHVDGNRVIKRTKTLIVYVVGRLAVCRGETSLADASIDRSVMEVKRVTATVTTTRLHVGNAVAFENRVLIIQTSKKSTDENRRAVFCTCRPVVGVRKNKTIEQ